MNTKKSLIDRLELIKVESGHSDKAFKNILASITGKTARTVRRWYSLESGVHESDIELIAKHFGKHVHWVRYGDRRNISTAVDQIMSSDHFGAVITKENKVEEVNFKFTEMMNLSTKSIKQQDICEYILESQSQDTVIKCKTSIEHAMNHGAHVDQFEMILGDNKAHFIESTTLNLNNERILRIIFDKGLVDKDCDQAHASCQNKANLSDNNVLNILFVDDDIANCQLYNSMLSIHNHNVNIFTNSLHALDDFRQNHNNYDLLISDIIMPEMTGDKLAEECRKIDPQLPVILCSGYADHLNKSTAEEFGVSYYLQKPIDSSELLSILKQFKAEENVN